MAQGFVASGGVHPPGPRWHRRKQARPGEILDAALAEFVQKGYSAARLEDIARSAGVTKGTVYLYFESKEALFKAMAASMVLPTVEAGEELLRTHQGRARDLVSKMLHMRWERFYHSPSSGVSKVLIAEAGNFPELARWYREEIVMRANAPLMKAMELGIERGEFRPMNVNEMVLQSLAPIWLAGLWKHAFLAAVGGEFGTPEFIDHWIETFLRGIERREAEA